MLYHLFPVFSSGYRVEKMDMEKGRWEPVKSTNKNQLLAPKLQEGHKYKFRVIAESPNGDSEPLELEDPITAKNPFGKMLFIESAIYRHVGLIDYRID